MTEKGNRVPWITKFSVEKPWLVISLFILATVGFVIQFPKVKIDTDPKNMLPTTSEVRVFNDLVDQWFSLHKDMIVLGIYNEKEIFNPETLERISRFTNEILKIEGVA